jgi:hypothetical protein
VVSTTADNSFTTTTNPASYSVIGVVVQNTASGANGKVAISGVVSVNLDNTVGGVIRGQHCITGSQAGKASGVAIPSAGTSVGVYLTSGAASGSAKVLLK